MPKLLSGSTLRRGGSGEFIDLASAQPQLPANEDTSTGYTVVTNSVLQTSYRNSLGNIEFYKGEAYSNLPNGKITLAGTGTGFVFVKKYIESTSTYTGSLVVEGGVGVGGGIYTEKDIVVNGLTIGRGYEGFNNIVINAPIAETPIDDFLNGQQSISIGWGSLQGIETSNRAIAIGRNALNTGTELRETIAIGDRALESSGNLPTSYIKNIVTATQTSPVTVITNAVHNLSTGMSVLINDVVGMVELNSIYYYVDVLSTNTVALYSDINLLSPIDGTTFNAYESDGVIYKKLLRENNIAIGTNAGRSLVDGKKNFFMGDNIATNLYKGNGNFYLGHDVSNNMYTGNANVSIMCDNLVDGLDNQIGIGPIFYYNGQQLLRLETNATIGIGTLSTNSNSGALVVEGGLGINANLNVGSVTNILSTAQSTSSITGALVVAGGAGIGKDLRVADDVYADNFIGLATTSTNLFGGATGSLPYQNFTGTTLMLPIGPTGHVLTSNGTTIEWDDPTSFVGDTSTDTLNIFIENVDPATTYNLVLGETINDFSPLNSTSSFTYNTTNGTLTTPSLQITNQTSATSTVTGALQVVGGVGVQGSIYSANGGVYENNLLYTPNVTVSTTAPLNSRIGDFWVDSVNGIILQYIQDGAVRFWIQISS